MNRWFMYYLSSSGKSIGVKTAPVEMSGDEVKIPANAEWTDHGVVFSEGPSGSWDRRFYGALSPCTVIKKNGTYFLYYIGADGDRSTDGGPRHRALGVATSPDGLHFTKRGRIITYLPHNNEEEGIFSAGAFLDVNGEIVMYWSALDAGSATSTTVDSDIRLAISNDGLHFTDKGDVISHAESKIWGYGDELFPVGAFREGSTYYVYYIAKGHGANWDLGLGWGPGRSSVGNNTKKVLAPSPRIIGGCDPMYLSASKIALFICLDNAGQVRTASVSSPGVLSGVVETYSVTKDYPNTAYLDIVGPPPPPTCPYCPATFDSQAELDDHIASLHPPGEWTANLLINPSAEQGWAGWAKDESGGPIRISCDWPTIAGAAGPCHFGYMGPTTRDNAVSRAWQDIDISGRGEAIDKGLVEVNAGGWRGNWGEVKDKNRLIIQYLTSDGGVITSYDTGWLGGGAEGTWNEYEDNRILPVGCRRIRVQMQWTTRYKGEHSSCRWDELYVQYRVREAFTETTVICPNCGSTLKLGVSSAESKNIAQICPLCDASIGSGYSVEVIQEGPIFQQLRDEIAVLNAAIADLKARIATVMAEIETIKEQMGL